MAQRLTVGKLIKLIEGFPDKTPIVGIYLGIVTHMDGVQEIFFNQDKVDSRKIQIESENHTTWPEMRLHTKDADAFGLMLTYE